MISKFRPYVNSDVNGESSVVYVLIKKLTLKRGKKITHIQRNILHSL